MILYERDENLNKVKYYIERKSMLYKTGVEYCEYAMNHVLGCSHGCKYPCYAFLMKKRFGQISSYSDWIEPKIVSNSLELLDKEIPKLKDKIKSVHLCFATDPFMYEYNEIAKISIEAIQKLNNAGIKCTVLTKGILPKELINFSPDNEYAISLISLNENYRQRMEPGTAPYQKRIDSLKYLYDNGCKTWVSIEPYPTPNLIEQDLVQILNAISFVDKIIFGRTNYNKDITEYKEHKIFYNDCAEKVVNFCNQHRIKYHIKRGTIN